MPIHLKRTTTFLSPDQSRVLLRPFSPGGPERAARIIARIMSLPEEQLGDLRFILSLRATGEGHISSITFRTGVVHFDQRIEVANPTGFLTEPRQVPNPQYEKPLFERKLAELRLDGEFSRRVLSKLGE